MIKTPKKSKRKRKSKKTNKRTHQTLSKTPLTSLSNYLKSSWFNSTSTENLMTKVQRQSMKKPSLKFSKVLVVISPKKNVREPTDWIIMTLWKLANGSLIKETKRKRLKLLEWGPEVKNGNLTFKWKSSTMVDFRICLSSFLSSSFFDSLLNK